MTIPERALYGFDMAVKQTAVHTTTLKCDKYQPLFLSLWLCADGEGWQWVKQGVSTGSSTSNYTFYDDWLDFI